MDKIDELLTKRVEKIYPSKKELEKVLRSGKKLRLYLGIDATARNLHLGHTIPIRKLQEFVELGHDVIFLFGTGTVLVGDPSERNSGRKLISEKEVKHNIATWKQQMSPWLDFSKITFKSNADWLTKLTLKDLIKIGSKISAVQLFKRDSFTTRIKKGDTVWYHETMYPLLQGYDSVAMDVDLEIGGTDQTFNMLLGRELQKKIRGKEKFVMTIPMIFGTDGKKMSKSSKNCILLTENPVNMYGQTMRLQDKLIPSYFENFTDLSFNKINLIKKDLKSQKANPMELKKKLAFAIVSQVYNKKLAQTAQDHFEKTIQSGQIPSKIPSFSLNKLSTNPLNVLELITETRLASSRSEAKRLVKQSAVELNYKKILEFKNIKIKKDDILRTGKRKWLKFT